MTIVKRIELAANVAIIIVAILIAAVFVRTYWLPKSETPHQPGPATIIPGTQLSLSGVDWKANGRTLVLALSTACHFCTESAPFYQRLAQERPKLGNTHVIAAFPQPVADAQKYLADHGVKVDAIIQTSLQSIGVVGTPTVILADDKGAIIESWRGKLSSEKENEVLARLR